MVGLNPTVSLICCCAHDLNAERRGAGSSPSSLSSSSSSSSSSSLSSSSAEVSSSLSSAEPSDPSSSFSLPSPSEENPSHGTSGSGAGFAFGARFRFLSIGNPSVPTSRGRFSPLPATAGCAGCACGLVSSLFSDGALSLWSNSSDSSPDRSCAGASFGASMAGVVGTFSPFFPFPISLELWRLEVSTLDCASFFNSSTFSSFLSLFSCKQLARKP